MPLNYDLYNEQIPEMSSDREASSFHTRRFTKARRRSLDGDDDSFDSEHQDIIGSIRTKGDAYAPTKGSYVHDSSIVKTFASQVRNSELGTSHDVSIRKTLKYDDDN